MFKRRFGLCSEGRQKGRSLAEHWRAGTEIPVLLVNVKSETLSKVSWNLFKSTLKPLRGRCE